MALSNKLLDALNPYKDAGKLLLVLNTAGMICAAVANTAAVIVDKNTKDEDKKILVPAGVITGVANIGAYFAITDKLIKSFKKTAKEVTDNFSSEKLSEIAKSTGIKEIQKAKNGSFFGLFGKKSEAEIKDIANFFFENGENSIKGASENIKDTFKNSTVTKQAKELIKGNIKEGAGIIGAFTGAVIGCAILTPIIRDVGAYAVQKISEKKNPELINKPYRPYFDPIHVKTGKTGFKKQPLSMQSYMSFTNGSMKI